MCNLIQISHNYIWQEWSDTVKLEDLTADLIGYQFIIKVPRLTDFGLGERYVTVTLIELGEDFARFESLNEEVEQTYYFDEERTHDFELSAS